MTGEIPRELGDLLNVQELKLANNYLTGEVPVDLAGLTQLEHLDINLNELSGCVPDDLKAVDVNLGKMRFCGDPLSIWTHRPVFDGGIDLGVAYIERLPRYRKYQIAYFTGGSCPYPFEEFRGPVVCPGQADSKRWPAPGESVKLIAHVWNFGDTASGPFGYEWTIDDESLGTIHHDGLESGEHAAIVLPMKWPDDDANPAVTFSVDPWDRVDELIEDNNVVVDWLKGYTLGFYFSPVAYESLRLSNQVGRKIQSAEHWVHNNISRLNELLAEAGLEDRVRAELLSITDEPYLSQKHDLHWFLDGWWGIWDFNPGNPAHKGHFNLENYRQRPDIEYALLHELLHQLGAIDLYQVYGGLDQMLVPDANKPDRPAGCGRPYWEHDSVCFRFPENVAGIMGAGSNIIGAHTAGGLATNSGHRRGYYGEYLYDTPESTVVRIVDPSGKTLPGVTVRFYQLELQSQGHVVDTIPEFILTTDEDGLVLLPNRGLTGIVTETGHQMRPNPFGIIDVVGTNGLFIMEMEGSCTNYEWLTVVELNLAYWDGHTDEMVFTKTLRCPPPP